jgi:hypothetical protein
MLNSLSIPLAGLTRQSNERFRYNETFLVSLSKIVWQIMDYNSAIKTIILLSFLIISELLPSKLLASNEKEYRSPFLIVTYPV